MQDKKATTTQEQIALLRERGMHITDVEHATQMLLSVGYYRLGFYWFLFEKSHNLNSRNHNFRKDTSWEKVEALYDFDDRFRNLLSFYLQTIETDIRTYITYTVSNNYKEDPIWFAQPHIMTRKFLEDSLPDIVKSVDKNDVIRRHRIKHPQNRYAPAWKTLEFLTFGEVQHLYLGIKDEELHHRIFERYHITREEIFISYLNVLREVRNVCAHSHILYDKKLHHGIVGEQSRLGLKNGEEFTIVGILKLIYYMLRQIDVAKEDEMRRSVNALVNRKEYDIVRFAISRIAF